MAGQQEHGVTTDSAIAVPTALDIYGAQARIAQHVHRTSLVTSRALDEWVGHRVLLKPENLQRVGAFKIRGATNAVAMLSPEVRHKGVAAHSSGNHAQALSLAAHTAGIEAHIVMPENSSQVKIDAVRQYGGLITFCDADLDARATTLTEVVRRTGATEIHPFDDFGVIAGQGTIALEMIEDAAHHNVDLDAIVAPIGGGGLLSGVAIAARHMLEDIELIGAEPLLADDAARSLVSGKLEPAAPPTTVADGLRTGLRMRTFGILQQYLSQIVTVTDDEIIEAMRFVWMRTKLIVEPSGAVPVAAVRKLPGPTRTIGVVISGGNVDLDALPW